MMSKSNTRLQNMLRQRKYYEKHREEVNAKRRANYSRSQFMDREGNEGQEREPVVLEASIVPPQQSNLIPPPPPRTDTVELGTECIRLLHLCTFKTPTSSAVMSEQGVNGCALLMRNCLTQRTSVEIQRNQAMKTLYCLEDDELALTEKISPEQKEGATQVFEAFENNPNLLHVVYIAPTQSGKTGTFCNIIRQFVERGDVPVNNLFCITGKSDISLKTQTQKRLPEILRKNIYHGPDLTTRFVKNIQGKSDCVIILDECQCASGKDNSLLNAFKKAGLLDKDELYRRNIRIVYVSATPNGILYDIQKWEEGNYKIIRGLTGQNYTSCSDLYGMTRVFEAKNLLNRENVIELGDRIIQFDADGNDPHYHIIRAYSGVRFQRMKDLFTELFWNLIEFMDYTQEKNAKDINDILSVRPNKHTIIFIKEKLRCGKSLVKTYIGVLYDRPATNTDDSVVIQGLLGRATGYDDNGKTVIYCNTQSIINYLPIIETGDFSSEYTGWNSSSTEVIGNTIHGKQTFADPAHYRGSGVVAVKKAKREPKPEAFHISLESFEELQDYYKAFNRYKYGQGHNKKGPNKAKKNADGYCIGTIRKISKQVLSLERVLHEKNNAVSEDKPCAYKACYTDVKDPNTLVFVFIHREPDFHYQPI